MKKESIEIKRRDLINLLDVLGLIECKTIQEQYYIESNKKLIEPKVEDIIKKDPSNCETYITKRLELAKELSKKDENGKPEMQLVENYSVYVYENEAEAIIELQNLEKEKIGQKLKDYKKHLEGKIKLNLYKIHAKSIPTKQEIYNRNINYNMFISGLFPIISIK